MKNLIKGVKTMKNLRNEKAVSPVIGVILMVVITVIIAAILAVFAFGIGGPVKAPEAQLKYTVTNGTTNFSITIENTGGDSLILNNTKISVYGEDGLTAITMGSVSMESLPAYGISSTTSFQTIARTLAPGKSIIRSNATVVSTDPKTGDILVLKVMDVPSGQLISSMKVTVQ